VLAGLCCNGYSRLLGYKKYRGFAKEKRNTKVLVDEPKETKQLQRYRCNNNKMDLKKSRMGWFGMNESDSIGNTGYLL
jgi:hypothetical protein